MEKHLQECLERRAAAAAELSVREPRLAAEQVTHSLVYGLNSLRNLLFTRIHEDVEANLGRDSMLLPLSVEASEHSAKCEIEAYQLVVAALAAWDRGWVTSDFKWFIGWLAQLRLGDDVHDSRWRRRVRRYVTLPEDEQRLSFSATWRRCFPRPAGHP